MADNGISDDVNVLEKMSAIIMKMAPNRMVKGIVCLVFFPTKARMMWGTTNPIQPMTPAKATLVAVMNVATTMISN